MFILRSTAWLHAALLAACASSTPVPVPVPVPVTAPASVTGTAIAAMAPVVEPAAPATGQVLARNDRFVIYQPAPGDTLGSIAAAFLGAEADRWVVGEFNAVSHVEAGRTLVVPLQALNPLGVQTDQYQTVPVLCYHRFGNGGGKMTVSAANFAAQLDWLARNDYKVVSLAQLAAFLEGRQALPKRSVVITIDDGYESVHRVALPLLRQHGFPATLFVYTDFIGAADALSWAQLQELVASGVFDVQAHSRSHRNLVESQAGQSDEAYRQLLKGEVRVPRELLERRLGVQVRHFAFPYGDANQALLDALKHQRYQLGLTVNPGGNGFFAQPLMLRRTMIYGDHDLMSFRNKLQIARRISAP